MANRIKLKRSSTPGNAPTTADIEVGEVALNMADQIIHFRDGADVIKEIVHGPSNGLEATTGEFSSSVSTVGLTNLGTNYGNRVSLQRANGGYTLEIQNDKSSTLASADDSAVMGFTVAATDAFADIGVIFGKYYPSGDNRLVMRTYNDGVSTYTLETCLDMSSSDFKILQDNLQINTATAGNLTAYSPLNQVWSSDGNIEFNAGTGSSVGLTVGGADIITMDSTSITNEKSTTFNSGLVNNGTNYGNRAVFDRQNGTYGVEIRNKSTSTLSDGDESTYIGYSVSATDTYADIGVMYGQYNSGGDNKIIMQVYNDGTTSYSRETVADMSSSEFKMLNNNFNLNTNTAGTVTGYTPLNQVWSSDGNIEFNAGSGSGLSFQINSVDIITADSTTLQLHLPVELETLSADPTGVTGLMYFNTTTSKFRGYNGSAWVDLG